MFARTYGATTLGVDGAIIDVEVDSASGLPGFDIVGLADTAVKESKERVRTAIRNSGIRLRQEKVTINLAPADMKKDSSGLDLPIAVGLLAAYGVLPMAVKARDRSFEKIFVARENAEEALLVEGLQVYGLKNLGELVQFLTGQEALEPAA
ncbi:MAG: ATP-dependent protease, partial [Selenomonas sp.]|nr:ATP-dependent protease [Selenomonas sp.]